MKAVILAAGFGSRLWPLSTSKIPKQFLPLIHNESLLAYTYRQLGNIVSPENVYVLVLEGMQELVTKELPQLEVSKLILVAARKSTLPHTICALKTITTDKSEPVLFKSVDQFIVNEHEAESSLSQLVKDYSSDDVTVLGMKVKEFNSNEGYCVVDDGKITKFIEKPSKEMFDGLMHSGNLYRSPLIYITSQQALANKVAELDTSWRKTALDLLQSTPKDFQRTFLKLPFLDISSELFARSTDLNFQEIAYEYIDVGRFEEVYKLNEQDEFGNVILGEQVILDGECRNNLIINESGQPLVVISRSDSIIVNSPNGSLVSSFSDAKKVGDIYKNRIHF